MICKASLRHGLFCDAWDAGIRFTRVAESFRINADSRKFQNGWSLFSRGMKLRSFCIGVFDRDGFPLSLRIFLPASVSVGIQYLWANDVHFGASSGNGNATRLWEVWKMPVRMRVCEAEDLWLWRVPMMSAPLNSTSCGLQCLQVSAPTVRCTPGFHSLFYLLGSDNKLISKNQVA